MKTISALTLFISLVFTGCYTQLYTQGYAARSVEGDYARETGSGPDTGLAEDSSGTAARDSAYRPASVVVNNYYHESPYYRGYLVDEWEYPYVSFGFYSSGYRDYYGAYWWNDPGYHRGGYYRGNRGYHGSYPSAGGGTSGPYKSDKRVFSPAPDRGAKGRRSSGSTYVAPAPKSSGEGNSSSSAPSSSGNDPQASPGSNSSSGSSGGSSAQPPQDNDDPPAKKGRRR